MATKKRLLPAAGPTTGVAGAAVTSTPAAAIGAARGDTHPSGGAAERM